jgi:prepilin-type N-terminal cleavage/methylation domain-containing protein
MFCFRKLSKHRTPPFGGDGFTLLEMSIVLLIIATLAGGAVAMLSASVSKRQTEETQSKLRLLQETLLKYRIAFDRLPCPSDITLRNDVNGYGIEVYTSATDTCTGANFVNGGSFTAGGMVPVKSLGLPDDAAIDGWGRRIFYMVDMRAAKRSAFASIDGSYISMPDTIARMTVVGGAAQSKTISAIYVLLSTGPNGHGGYSRGTAATPTRINVRSSNTNEQDNCDCDNTATATTATFDKFVQAMPTQSSSDIHNEFDDIVVFATRQDLRSPNE